MPRSYAAAARLTRVLTEIRDRGRRLLVLGIGNEMLGDDAVGVRIAEDLAPRNGAVFLAMPVGVSVENAAHLVRRHRADVVILIDAAVGLPHRGWGFIPPMRLDTFCHSTHSIPLSLFVRIWREDNPKLVIHFVGVQPVRSDFGEDLSPAVEQARREIVSLFEKEVDSGHRAWSKGSTAR